MKNLALICSHVKNLDIPQDIVEDLNFILDKSPKLI